MESILPPMYRHGLVSGCNLLEFGNTSTCTPEANETDGLWTAIVLAGEVFRHAVTGAADALAAASAMFQGMQLLNNITGIDGLMARTVLSPAELPHPPTWINATVPGYAGWVRPAAACTAANLITIGVAAGLVER